ncbi:fimbrial assembly protein [Dyella solisilvae]|uniref:Fimbrial assembly protein n=1 Tax=Dyella solisilvae TaxID=1920168 RepID=A0A370K722_9GAMM|nr:PilN domain-containing protein [Dyella solisilvae]RDI98461.1 fimbrial assembly protein [Dyella solisilvae]
MAHINLLPWRVDRRKQREREFFMQLAAAFVAAVLVLFVWAFWMDQRVDTQNERNTYLTGEIKQLDERIAKIKDLEKVRERLLARKQIIEQLQANRSQMVHLFDELVKTIPASARLGGLKQVGDSMTLEGVAQSNASVAEYMRNIEASPWMGHADLRKTENTHGDSRLPYAFGLDVALSRPKSDENSDGSDDRAPILPAAAPNSAPATAGTAAAHPAPAAAAEPGKPAAAANASTGGQPTSPAGNGGAKP